MLGIHDLAKLQALIAEMLDGATRSCRALAADLELGKNTIWRWRSKIMTALSKLDAPSLEHVVVAQAHIVRESRKASREWVRHAADPVTWPAPDRPRWIDVDSGRLSEPLPRALYRVPLLAVMDEIQGRHAVLWPKPGTSVSNSEMVLPDGHLPSTLQLEQPHCHHVDDERGSRHGSNHKWTIDRRALSADHRQDAKAASHGSPRETLRQFLQPFRGPATKHLRGYVAWFNAAQSGAALPSFEQALATLLSFRPTQYEDMRVAPP